MSETRRPIGLISVDTGKLYDRLLKLQVGEVASYEELSTIIGRDVQREAKHNLESARNKIQAEHGRVIEVMRGLGVKYLTDSEVANLGHGICTGIRRKANRGARKLQCVDNFAALSREDQMAHNASISLLGAIRHFTGSHQIKKLEAKVADAQASLPVQRTLELFQGKGVKAAAEEE